MIVTTASDDLAVEQEAMALGDLIKMWCLVIRMPRHLVLVHGSLRECVQEEPEKRSENTTVWQQIEHQKKHEVG
jgi:hypothetical protein